jgi:hypothetical protein
MAVNGSISIQNDREETIKVESLTFFDDVAEHGGLRKGDRIGKNEEKTLTIGNESVLPPKGVGVKIQLQDESGGKVLINFEIPAVGAHTLKSLEVEKFVVQYSTLDSDSNAYKATIS